MALFLLFLFSSVVTARHFEKRKMSTASVLYSILFIITLLMSLFALDDSVINAGLINIIGEEMFGELRNTIQGIISTDFGGFSLLALFGVSCALQIAFVIFVATSTIVSYFVAKKPIRRFIKAYFRFVLLVRNLYLPKRINILYCRMLN